MVQNPVQPPSPVDITWLQQRSNRIAQATVSLHEPYLSFLFPTPHKATRIHADAVSPSRAFRDSSSWRTEHSHILHQNPSGAQKGDFG